MTSAAFSSDSHHRHVSLGRLQEKMEACFSSSLISHVCAAPPERASSPAMLLFFHDFLVQDGHFSCIFRRLQMSAVGRYWPIIRISFSEAFRRPAAEYFRDYFFLIFAFFHASSRHFFSEFLRRILGGWQPIAAAFRSALHCRQRQILTELKIILHCRY